MRQKNWCAWYENREAAISTQPSPSLEIDQQNRPAESGPELLEKGAEENKKQESFWLKLRDP